MILRCKFTVEDYVAAYRTFAHRGARLWMSRACLFAGIGSLLFGVWLTTLPKGSFSLALPMFFISLMWLFFGRPWWRDGVAGKSSCRKNGLTAQVRRNEHEAYYLRCGQAPFLADARSGN